MKTLHYNILYFVRKYWTKSIYLRLITFSRHPSSDSSKLHQFVSFDVLVMFLIVFHALFTEFCNCACAKKIVMLIRIRYTCVALLHKKTVLSLETSSEVNFEFIKFVKKGKCLPLTKTNREYYINITFPDWVI